MSVGGSPGTPFTLTGPVSVIAYGRTNDSELGTFNTQMLSMDLTGSVGGHSVEVMLDPSQSTLGQTTIAASGNMFHITSFFDVFTGDQSRPRCVRSADQWSDRCYPGTIPEPSTFVMGAIAATVGLAYAASRRRRAQTDAPRTCCPASSTNQTRPDPGFPAPAPQRPRGRSNPAVDRSIRFGSISTAADLGRCARDALSGSSPTILLRSLAR